MQKKHFLSADDCTEFIKTIVFQMLMQHDSNPGKPIKLDVVFPSIHGFISMEVDDISELDEIKDFYGDFCQALLAYVLCICYQHGVLRVCNTSLKQQKKMLGVTDFQFKFVADCLKHNS